MLRHFLAIILLGSLVVAKIPSYMKICGRRNPNLSECVKNSVKGLHDKIRTGMPELDVPSLEPLILKGFPLADTAQLKAYATNVKFYGFPNFEVKELKVDLENKQIDIEVVFGEIIIDADNEVKAKILVPIQGQGPIHITTKGVVATVNMKYKLVKKTGGDYLYFTTMTTKLNIKNYKAEFTPKNGANSEVLGMAVKAAIEGGHQEILDSIRPALEKVVSEEILRLSNNICKHFTFNELFPDRE